MVCSRVMENMIFSTCELVFTSVLRSSAFVVVMWKKMKIQTCYLAKTI